MKKNIFALIFVFTTIFAVCQNYEVEEESEKLYSHILENAPELDYLNIYTKTESFTKVLPDELSDFIKLLPITDKHILLNVGYKLISISEIMDLMGEYKKDVTKDNCLAILILNNLFTGNSSDVAVYYLRALAKNNIEDNLSAIADLSKAIQIDSNFIEAYHKRGKIKTNIKDFYGGINDLSSALKIADETNYDDKENLYFLRAYCYQQTAKPMKVIADINRAIEINPNDGRYYGVRGVGYYFLFLQSENLNDKKRACENFSRAIDFGMSDYYEIIKKVCN
jgi:tetratricopeptide (TPR) repeat protein